MTDKITMRESTAEGGKKTKSQTKTLVACLTLALSVLFHQGGFAKTITTQDSHQTSTEVVILPDSVGGGDGHDGSDCGGHGLAKSLRGLPGEIRVEPVEETPEERAQREWEKFLKKLRRY